MDRVVVNKNFSGWFPKFLGRCISIGKVIEINSYVDNISHQPFNTGGCVATVVCIIRFGILHLGWIARTETENIFLELSSRCRKAPFYI